MKERITGVTLSADERWIAVGNDEGHVTLYDLTDDPGAELQRHDLPAAIGG